MARAANGGRGRAYNNLLRDWRAATAPEADPEHVARFWQAERGLGLHPRVKLVALYHSSVSGCAIALELSDEQLGEDHPNPHTLEVVGRWLWDNCKIDPDRFWDSVVEGDKAIDDVDTWLRTGQLPLRTQISLLPETPFETSRDRRMRLRETLNFISSPTLKPILTIAGDGMSEGLRAFALQLVKDLKDAGETRPVVYLPASRNPLTNDKVSYPQLVAYLRAFYARERITEALPATSADALRLDLEAIRGAMTREASIIILDGWSGFTGGLTRLGSAMIDDGLVTLIEEIIHPCRGVRAGLTDPAEFTRNRIIVLAATETQVLDAFAQPGAKSLPPPEAGEPMRRIAKLQTRSVVMAGLAKDMVHDRTDVSLALMDFLTRGLDEATAAPLRATLLGGEKTLVPEVLRKLSTKPLAFLIVGLAVLMPDGIRLTTIARITRTWMATQARASLGGPWPTPETFDIETLAGELDVVVDWLGPLLSLGQDAPISGLDDRDYPRERLEFGVDLDQISPDHRYLDFTAPRLRPLFADRLTAEVEDRPAIARLHRLLAEDMLAQYNRIARHGDWRDANDVRFYRRLIQALYHGFCSLARGPSEVDLGLKALSAAALPTDPTIAYLRLYAVHYRALLEAPPEWNLSRSLGRDDVKTDLIKLMLNLDGPRPWERLEHRESLVVRKPIFLSKPLRGAADPVAIARGQRTIFADQMASLAKAALRNNDLPTCDSALKEGLNFVEDWLSSAHPGGELAEEASEARGAYLGLAKTKIDFALVSSANARLGHVLNEARTYLVEGFGFRAAWLKLLDDAVLSLTARTKRSDGVEDPKGAGSFPDAAREILDAFARVVGEQSSEDLSAWSDLMGLMAEIHVLAGEHRDAPTNERTQEILKAYLLLTAADRLRRGAFDGAPLKRDFHLNAHSTRVLVRACLQLIKLGRQKGSSVPVETTDYLVSQTRRQLDILGRYVARFSTEKPSLLILEAAFARQAGTTPKVDLAIAERLLSEADDLMRAVTHRPRVRLRLMRERAKVYRGLARVETDLAVKQAYVDLTYLEIWRLELLAESAKLELWKSIAAAQREKMDDLVAALNLKISEEIRRLI